ncbi:hypothetical protein [Dactylosporangium sp. CA-139066]|uniref:hypothetical protein n=1 Tax=Dactylosporangium sp. CA-139066 TaxID=3239930 RepID=UPI003D93EEF8
MRRRRVVSLIVGLAAGAATYLIAGRFVSPTSYGPLIVAAGAAVLVAMGVSELWLAMSRAGRVIDAAIADALGTDTDQDPGGDGGPHIPVVATSADATVVYDADRLRVWIVRPKGRHRRPSKAGAR